MLGSKDRALDGQFWWQLSGDSPSVLSHALNLLALEQGSGEAKGAGWDGQSPRFSA